MEFVKPTLDNPGNDSFAKFLSIGKEEYQDHEKDKADLLEAADFAERSIIRRRFFDWRDNRETRLQQAISDLVPFDGLMCTISYWSDRRAAVITKVISPSKVVVQHLKTECKDYYAGEYDILREIEAGMGAEVFTKRKNGKWIQEGQSSKDGVRLLLHFCGHYIDPSY